MIFGRGGCALIDAIDAKQQYYDPDAGAWQDKIAGVANIHMCLTDINATTGYVLIDLSDTTNFLHSNTGIVYLNSYQVSINPDDNFIGGVDIGFLENVDATDGDFIPLFCWRFEKKSATVNQVIESRLPIIMSSDYILGNKTENDTTWQTDTALSSPYDYTAPYTTTPGNGDVVMKITRTAGTTSMGVSLRYGTLA